MTSRNGTDVEHRLVAARGEHRVERCIVERTFRRDDAAGERAPVVGAQREDLDLHAGRHNPARHIDDMDGYARHGRVLIAFGG
jgi:hypothetical protein